MSDESMWRAVHAMNDAADRANRAANRIEEATQQLRVLFEDGYGGNALKLIELLESHQKPVVLDDATVLAWGERNYINYIKGDVSKLRCMIDDAVSLPTAIEAAGGIVEELK